MNSPLVSANAYNKFDETKDKKDAENRRIEELREAARMKKYSEDMAKFRPTREFVDALFATLDR